MDYSVEAFEDEQRTCWMAKVSGEIDIFSSARFADELTALVNEKPIDLILDCGGLKFFDSSALGALVTVLKKVKTHGKSIHLRNLKPSLEKNFRITSLDKVFVIEGENNEQI